jgi:hypothetical protein
MRGAVAGLGLFYVAHHYCGNPVNGHKKRRLKAAQLLPQFYHRKRGIAMGIKGFKGFNQDMICYGGFKYEIGGEYKTKTAKAVV